MTTRANLALLTLAASTATLAGCGWPPAAMSPSGFATLPAMAGMAYGVASAKHGPSVSFENDSETNLRVRYWVGRVDVRAPSGVTDIRTDDDMVAELGPRLKARTNVGRSWWLTGLSDSIVRVRVDDMNNPGSEPIWFEFKQGGPMFVRATGQPGSLAIEPLMGTLIEPVPRSLWIPSANGPFPDYRVSQPAPVQQPGPAAQAAPAPAWPAQASASDNNPSDLR
ncbi:MAG: hypothetical protein IBJ11_07305 [Phycisphaerales bacterium]|nr:hypothetical protein [Phycisphaerales bacterium]